MRFAPALVAAILVLAAIGGSRAQHPPRRALVELVVLTHPTHEFPASLERAIAEGLRDELQVEVQTLPRRPLPDEAFYARRRRYRADVLLDHLRPLQAGEPETTKVLGFTAADISTTARGRFDWGVFGLGDLGGRAAVLSTFRLRRNARDDAHFTFRVVTTAVHEVGHTLGLEHCTEPRCVMNDAHGSIATVDGSDGHLGPVCRARVDRSAPLR
ncbi:MAG: matrixin family metalloprotease [Sandaracinus sp.]|nr:matrixin family metalloprotease [Sandaracinus sp.]